MKSTKKFIFLIVLSFLLVSFKGFCQERASKDSLNLTLINAAKEIMIAAGNCALITLDKEGSPRARVMDPFAPESDLTVWFGTNSKSRKVNQIKNDSRVTLYYFDSNSSGNVTIQGNALLVDDQKEKEMRWKEEWNDFYPDRSEGYLLIKVIPIWMEVISSTRGIFGDTITWQPPRVLFDIENN